MVAFRKKRRLLNEAADKLRKAVKTNVLLSTCITFAALGAGYYVLSSSAATVLGSFEAENGNRIIARIINDTQASSGAALQFGDGEATEPPNNEFPTPETTGPRISNLTPSGPVTSMSDGQVIQGLHVTGRVTVKHDNVIVRDTKINGTSTYMITTEKKADGTCPVNVRFEYIEIDGSQAAENDIPIYASCGNMFIDYAYVHKVGRSSRLTNNMTIQNSFIFSNRTGDSGAHRGGIGINGGSNNVIRNNTLKCSGTGCSAAIPNYGDFSQIDNLLIEHNLLATTGGYCMYGGSVDGKPFPDGSSIRIINNHFSTEFHPGCGRYGTLAGWEGNVRGNESSGNVWHETGEPIIFPNKIGV